MAGPRRARRPRTGSPSIWKAPTRSSGRGEVIGRHIGRGCRDSRLACVAGGAEGAARPHDLDMRTWARRAGRAIGRATSTERDAMSRLNAFGWTRFAAVAAIAAVAVYRITPHMPNLTPVGAMFVLGGLYLGRSLGWMGVPFAGLL